MDYEPCLPYIPFASPRVFLELLPSSDISDTLYLYKLRKEMNEAESLESKEKKDGKFDWTKHDFPVPVTNRHEYSGPSGALCDECKVRDWGTDGPLETHQLNDCLLEHSDLASLALFRVQSFPIRKSMPPTTVEELSLPERDGILKTRDYEVPTHGPVHKIKIELLEVRGVPPFELEVQQFDRETGDDLEKRWVSPDGEKRSIDLGAWALANVTKYIATEQARHEEQHVSWCLNFGSPLKEMIAVMEDPKAPLRHQKLFHKLSIFMFAAMQKTSTAVIVEGAEKLGIEAINEPGHRLHGCKLAPRMLLAQQDAIDTLAILTHHHRQLLDLILPLFSCRTPEDWGALLTALACLSTVCSRMFQDRRRHASENDHPTYYTMPEFVRDSSKLLMILIARFHDAENTLYDRRDCLKRCPLHYRRIFQAITFKRSLAHLSPTDINVDTWWLGQLIDDPETFQPHKTPDWPIFDFTATLKAVEEKQKQSPVPYTHPNAHR